MAEKNTKAQEFITAHSKLNDAGDARAVNQSAYLDYMQNTHLITPETIKAVSTAERELVTGAMEVATSDLAALITKAKAAGDDPSELSAAVRISRPGGPLSVDVRAERTTTNPSTGAKIVNHGVVGVKVRAKTLIDPAAAKVCEGIISGLLG